MTPQDSALENPSGQPLAGSSPGEEHAIPASLDMTTISAPGLDPTRMTKTKGKAETKETPKVEALASPPVAQPTEKDYRHAQQKITEEVEKKIRLAERLVEKDPSSIYEIAKEDPHLAESILKRKPELGAKNAEELLARQEYSTKDVDSLREHMVSNDSKVRKIEETLREERIQRLKERHSDLQGEVEAEFRKMYSDARFESVDPTRLIGVARALAGKPTPPPSATDVTLELLRSQEGSQFSLRSSGGAAPLRAESPQQANVRQRFGHSDADVEKYLPANVEEFLKF